MILKLKIMKKGEHLNIKISQSNIDFSNFIGRKVIEILPIGKDLINVIFDKGSLNVECSWRLRDKQGLIIGTTERKETDRLSIIKQHLVDTSITEIYHFEPTDDMIIAFKNDTYLDLFSDSSIFEQYQLYNGEDIFLIG
ncbi:hypothetical protein [Metabacillus niabensis]|uniref:hypothetical protein n=1 Tax=Metabacillus niabensis TaxID=324854 RepID=UPI0036712900